jgi:transcription elongation factor GreA
MITKLGKQKLEERLQQLNTEFNSTCENRGKAAEEGDLKENSAYIFLGERAQVLSSQIAEIKEDLEKSKVQSAPIQANTIVFGSNVKVKFESDGREMEITLVGKNDSSLKPSWISHESPLGIALMNQTKGSKITVNDQSVTILDVSIGDI